MNELFGSAPLGAVDWLKSTLFALVGLPIISLEKRLHRQREARGEVRPKGQGAPPRLPLETRRPARAR
jgi:hypothetical protein